MYKYFEERELTCRHCGKSGMNKYFMTGIETLREAVDFPFIISSAYRCPDHPIEASKSSPGAHTSGRAMDIVCRGKDAHKLLQEAMKMGFSGIGVSQKGDSRFIHLDDLEDSSNRPRPWIWSY
tara:strand:- start:5000 stop:5368 length:369 start_codon:yes stop_codon:yes gene_type:complete